MLFLSLLIMAGSRRHDHGQLATTVHVLLDSL
jgi:hypothetical protein